MKKFLVMCLLVSSFINAVPLYAANNYQFASGADTKSIFGKSTSSDEIVPVNAETTNVRRNKDAAYFPPSYGIFSGEIPTDHSSLYHNNDTVSYKTKTGSNVDFVGSSVNTSAANNIVSDSVLPDTVLPTTTISATASAAGSTSVLNTSPWKYDDGSIGSLHITKINKTLKVYEGESLENMRKGIGHFESTSAWDGNVGFAAHNRGASGYFGFVKDLEIGDKITYTTRYGVRNYKIVSKIRINDTDYTSLGWTDKNTLTLITCVENKPSLRWSVQAEEIK
jgi:sortase A